MSQTIKSDNTGTVQNILAIAEFLGDEMTDDQAIRMIDEIKKLSIADREIIYQHIEGRLYTEMSMHNAEMGGLHNY